MTAGGKEIKIPFSENSIHNFIRKKFQPRQFGREL